MKKWLNILAVALLFGTSAAEAMNVFDVYRLMQEKNRLEEMSHRRASGFVTDEVVASRANVTAQTEVQAPVVAVATYYEVKPGDTLLSRFGARATPEVCRLNKLANCNVIFVGQKLRLPDNVRGQDGMMVFGNTVQKTGVPKAKPPVVSCITLGAAPWNPDHNLARTLQGIDLLTTLTPAQRELAKRKVVFGERATEKELVGQQIFKEMLYQSTVGAKEAKHVYDKPICSSLQGGRPEVMDTYDLGEGVYLSIPRRCGNPAVFLKPVPRKEPPAAVPQEPPMVPVLPAPSQEEPPLLATPPIPVPLEKEGRSVCLFDPRAVIGQEHEPKHEGNDAHSTFLSAALDCTWRGESGTHGVGFGFQGSWWNGKVNGGLGEFWGRMLAFGPGYKYQDDTGWNVDARLLFGRIHENFDQGDYASSRTINLVGPAVSANLGQRRARGEKFLPETRLFGIVGWPTSVEANHSWQGKSIADTSELSRFGSYLNLGVHQDVYDFESFTLWGRVGYFRESPVSETMNLRIGISDPQRICGIGVGLDFDLMNGGDAKGWGWWCDVVKGVNVVRAEYRLSQVVKETGASFEEDGTLFVPMPSVAKPAN